MDERNTQPTMCAHRWAAETRSVNGDPVTWRCAWCGRPWEATGAPFIEIRKPVLISGVITTRLGYNFYDLR